MLNLATDSYSMKRLSVHTDHNLVPGEGLEPPLLTEHGSKPCASAIPPSGLTVLFPINRELSRKLRFNLLARFLHRSLGLTYPQSGLIPTLVSKSGQHASSGWSHSYFGVKSVNVSTTKRLHSSAPRHNLERNRGVEPLPTGWKPVVLPLN